MHCYLHPDVEATGLCSHCGYFVCETCEVKWQDKCFCSHCADKIITRIEPNRIPDGIVSVAPGKVSAGKSAAGVPDQLAKSPTLLTPLPASDTVSKPDISPVQEQKSIVSPVDIPETLPSFPNSFSLRNLSSLFSLNVNFYSLPSIVSYVVGLAIFISIFLLPWAVASGFGLNLIMVNGVTAVFGIFFLVLYLSTTLVVYRGVRSLARITCALFCIVLWLVFFFTTFQEISQFSMSAADMMGMGLWVFIFMAVLAIIFGVLELFLRRKSIALP